MTNPRFKTIPPTTSLQDLVDIQSNWDKADADLTATEQSVTQHKVSIAAHNATAIVFTPGTSGMNATTADGAIKELNSRTDNLVLNAGNSNPEIVDGRYDRFEDYVYGTIGKRMDSILLRVTDQRTPIYPVRFLAKLGTFETGVAATFPSARIESDSLGEGAGVTSGVKKWHYKAMVEGSTVEYITGKIGQNLSIPTKFALGTSIACARNGIGGSTSPLGMARIAAHVYKPDPTYSTSDILDVVNNNAACDLLIICYGNNEYVEVGMNKFKWFIEETIRAAKSQGIDVMLIVPHDRATGTVGQRTLDQNSLKQAQNIILSLAEYYGCGVMDMRARFRQLVNDGLETADTLFPYNGDEFGALATDNVHTNNRGQEYYALELLNSLPSFDEIKINPQQQLATRLPNRIYRQPSFFVNVNRWKLVFDNEASFTTVSSTAYGNSVNYPSTRSLFGKSDIYWKLQNSGEKVRFRGLGGSVGVLFMKQSSEGSATVKVNGILAVTVSFTAQSEKEYLYFVGNNYGYQEILNIDIEWASGVIGVSGILVGAARDPHHIDSHPSSIVSFTGSWADNATFKETTTQNDSFSVTFLGTGLILDLPLGSDYGIVSVSVDGGAATTIDGYSSSAVNSKIRKAASGLAYGIHTAVLTVSTKNASSTGYRCKVRNYRAIDQRIDAEVYETLTASGVTLYVPEDRQGTVTSADSVAPGQISVSATRQKYRTSILN
ncbi:MAG: hypothetical protein K0Q73_6139 [Paenibacillus sp.]|jgi:hypothetical protein|nr:hypothetical protein [Paenibacillus sp.]